MTAISIKNAYAFAARRPTVAEALAKLARAPGAAILELLVWQERARQRRHLMELDDRLLKDIGITRAEARAEYEKPPYCI